MKKRSTDSTNVNERSTDSTVNDNVTVNVNDNEINTGVPPLLNYFPPRRNKHPIFDTYRYEGINLPTNL